ncbi:uncharacterized protein LOC108733388 [Agrilus planipennis]|uniref:Uncharacterized protein LOC108733388 n=1 Tax=Agrilus planipennis TaxID=224129 RepID=A0A1W4W7G7_AGRPL|nr:uncharacterized protein LOC108733388 [Agrilus planipennis]XP_018320035.1 uncharacterized protein LOC108733388 [Agrilus planipennis]
MAVVGSAFGFEDYKYVNKNLQNFVEQMLKGRLFMGIYTEQRYVLPLNSYRHVVSIPSTEKELIEDLSVVLRKLQKSCPSDTWIGITTSEVVGAPSHHCVWVELPQNVFGSYWFKIRGVNFTKNEVSLKLKTVRIIESTITNPPRSELESPVKTSTSEELSWNSFHDNLNKSLNTIKISFLQNSDIFFKEVATFSNFVNIMKFLAVLLITVATCSVNLSKFLCDFLLKLIHELSHFLQVSTPILITIINTLGKIVGGFYLLIAMMWRDFWGTPPPPRTNQYLYRKPLALSYR